MPKRLNEFTADDWKRLRPVTQTWKTLRYAATNAIYVRMTARDGDPAAIARQLAGRKLLTTIAYGDPQLIEWQLDLIRRYVAHEAFLVADNSQDDGAAAAIRALAERAGAHYIRLPRNFAIESRSHGLALNWTWRNIILPGKPKAFGFLDHDFFPTAPDDPFAPLATQDFYGIVRYAKPRWFLWAGFCLFDFAAVKDKPLDFGQDWFIGLDTGGGNWEPLFRRTDLASIKIAPIIDAPYREDVPISASFFQWSDGWLHEVGVAGQRELKADKRKALADVLAPHLRQ